MAVRFPSAEGFDTDVEFLGEILPSYLQFEPVDLLAKRQRADEGKKGNVWADGIRVWQRLGAPHVEKSE